jgi:hypothetical protein
MSAAHTARLAALATFATICASCVSFRYDRTTVNAPPKKGVVAGLATGKTSLADALQALGAPLYVWEYKGDGIALAWGWSEDKARGIKLSVPIDRGQSASASYDDLAKHLHGVVLLFDAELVLEQMRTGYLNELRAELDRRRPAPPPIER